MFLSQELSWRLQKAGSGPWDTGPEDESLLVSLTCYLSTSPPTHSRVLGINHQVLSGCPTHSFYHSTGTTQSRAGLGRWPGRSSWDRGLSSGCHRHLAAAHTPGAGSLFLPLGPVSLCKVAPPPTTPNLSLYNFLKSYLQDSQQELRTRSLVCSAPATQLLRTLPTSLPCSGHSSVLEVRNSEQNRTLSLPQGRYVRMHQFFSSHVTSFFYCFA